MGNKDINVALQRIAQGLTAGTDKLRDESREFFSLQFFIIIFPFVMVCIVFLVETFTEFASSEPVALLFYYFVFFICLYSGMRKYYHLKTDFLTVRDQCGRLTDAIDWTIMRKKQVYGKLDEDIQKPIDDFYEYASSHQCPFYGGKAKFVRRNVFMILEFVAISVVAILSLSDIHLF